MSTTVSARTTREVRHPRAVRLAHWVNTAAFLALVVSGVGILLAHPRFYWGETGYFDTPAAFELPLAVDKSHTWWGRNVHFLAAWVTAFNGLVYVAWGLAAGHFVRRLIPTRAELGPQHVVSVIRDHLRLRIPHQASRYNVLQKIAYVGVVFVLLPLTILTGLTMSPGITAAFPQLFTLWGGRQSARTIHFIVANVLVLFVLVHLAMIGLAGFLPTVASMVTGRDSRRPKETP